MDTIARIALVAVACGFLACGGASKRASGEQPDSSEAGEGSNPASPSDLDPSAERGPTPDEIDVRVTRRFGELVRLDIKGIRRGIEQGGAFEKYKRWNVTAVAAKQVLTRAVNGPARIVREPVGSATSNLWDVEVTFWVAFNVPETVESMVVRVAPPQSEAYETTLRLGWGDMEEPGSSD